MPCSKQSYAVRAGHERTRLKAAHKGKCHLAPKLRADLVAALADLKGDNLAAGVGASANAAARLALAAAGRAPRHHAAALAKRAPGAARSAAQLRCACAQRAPAGRPSEWRRSGGRAWVPALYPRFCQAAPLRALTWRTRVTLNASRAARLRSLRWKILQRWAKRRRRRATPSNDDAGARSPPARRPTAVGRIASARSALCARPAGELCPALARRRCNRCCAQRAAALTCPTGKATACF